MPTVPRADLHIHTHHLKCANGTMQFPAIVAECERVGVTTLAITDHLNSLDKLPLHELIREELLALETPLRVYFGAELNFDGPDGHFAFSAEVKERMGFQFAIGGIHATYLDAYDERKLVDIQHRHHLRTCQDPLVDVLVHPYWFGKGEFDQRGFPWFETMQSVPESYARELGQVARETGTAIEINASANLVEALYGQRYVAEYEEYVAIIAEEGPLFTTSSDAHDIRHLGDIQKAWDVAERLGLPADRFWLPPGEPFIAPAAATTRSQPG